MKTWSIVLVLFCSLTTWADQKVVAEVEGMTCESCEESIRKSISQIGDVISVQVSQASKRAEVVVKDHTQFAEKKIQEAIEGAGYTVKKITGEKKK